jgi:hypothetical protein
VLSHLRSILRFRDTEVYELHLATARDHDVLRRYVTVHDREGFAVGVVSGVRVLERVSNVNQRQNDSFWRKIHSFLTSKTQELMQVVSRDELHDQEVLLVDGAEIKHLRDVGMMELDGNPCFIDEHLRELVVLTERAMQAFERNDVLSTVTADDRGLVDLCHPPFSYPLEEGVLAKFLTRSYHRL